MLSVIAAGALVAAALALLLGSSSATHAGPSDRVAATATDNLTENLAVLRRPTAATDALPAHVVKALEAIPGGSPEPELARRATVTPYGQSVYVVPTSTGRACMADSDLSEVVCAGLPEIAEGRASAGNACLPDATTEVEIAGLLPDGAENPDVVLSDGDRTTLPVHENTYLVRFARSGPLPVRIAWTDADGTHSATTSLPLDAGSVTCAPPAEGGGTTGGGSNEPEHVTVYHNPT